MSSLGGDQAFLHDNEPLLVRERQRYLLTCKSPLDSLVILKVMDWSSKRSSRA